MVGAMRICILLLLSSFVLTAQPGSVSSSPQGQPTASPAQSPPAIHASPDAQQQEEATSSDQFRAAAEEGVKHMLVSQIEAWNHHQLEGFMRGYWRSPDLTFFSSGTVTKGWEPTLQRYRQRYQSQGKEMGQLEFQDLNIDIVGRKAAVVTGSWHLTMSDGSNPHGLFTLIVKKMPGGWRIVHDHTSAAE
jgi:ketosteroid isomerase-like protein